MDEYREKCTAWSKGAEQRRKRKLSDQYLELVKLSEFKKHIQVSSQVECHKESLLQGL